MTPELLSAFHVDWYNGNTWTRTYWRGVEAHKCAFDLWLYQEIIYRCRPHWIIETGTYRGGTTGFLADVCDLIGCGQVLTVDVRADIEIDARVRQHPRVRFLHGCSASPEVLRDVRWHIQEGETVMAILDADHRAAHVSRELASYGELITEGQYLIVEDTNINGRPVIPEYGPGPAEAIEEFLATPLGGQFAVDEEMHKFFVSFNWGGYLRRIAPR